MKGSKLPVETTTSIEQVRPYIYKELPSVTSFRLLTIFPGPQGHWASEHGETGGIHGSLSTHDVRTDIEYECLSYTWGSGLYDRQLFLDGCAIKIKANLHAALRRLQYPDRPRLVWIDFLCINQENLDERGQQVQLMYQIFSKATRVIAYLGEEADGSEGVPEILDKIENVHIEQGSISKPFDPNEYEEIGLPRYDSEEIAVIEYLLSRPWWTRAWIMQEFIAAKELHFVCGSWVRPHQKVIDRIVIASQRAIPIIGKLPISPDERSSAVPQSPARQGFRQMLAMYQLSHPRIDLRRDFSLMDLLEITRPANATDARDKVYAWLNMCHPDDVSVEIVPDYNISTKQFFEHLARTVTDAGYGWRIILNAGVPGSNLGMPSWVPDWSLVSIPYFTIVNGSFMYGGSDSRRTPKRSYAIRLGDDNRELVALTSSLGHIDTMEPLCIRRPGAHRDDLWRKVTADRITSHTTRCWESRESDRQHNAQAAYDPSDFERYTYIHLSDEHHSEPELPPEYVLARTAIQYVKGSQRYPKEHTFDAVWQTLLCAHLRGTIASERQRVPISRKTFMQWYRMTWVEHGPEQDLEDYCHFLEEILWYDNPKFAETKLDLQSIYTGILNVKDSVDTFENALTWFCYDLRLARTDAGYVGMVPSTTEPGDFAVCIKDVPAPFILRKTADGRSTIVGQAYFWGFMEGQAWVAELKKSDEWQEIRII